MAKIPILATPNRPDTLSPPPFRPLADFSGTGGNGRRPLPTIAPKTTLISKELMRHIQKQLHI